MKRAAGAGANAWLRECGSATDGGGGCCGNSLGDGVVEAAHKAFCVGTSGIART
jgi:hypothetical protein